MDFGSLSHAAAVDSHGCEFDAFGVMAVHTDTSMGGARRLPKAPAGSKYILASAVLPVVPRREKTFELRLYDDRKTFLGKFIVRNPLYRRYPTWKPEPLRVNHSAGDLTVSLVGLSNRWTSTYHDGLEVKRFSLTPDFRIPPDWELSDLHMEDATGNRGVVDFPPEIERRLRGRSLWGRELLATRFQLCTNESAWKMRAAFFRTAQGHFASNETWTIPNLKIPSPGVAKVLSGSHTWQQTTVRLCAISGSGSFTYSNGVPVSASARIASGGSGSGPYISVGAQKPQVMLEVSGLNEECRFDGIARVNDKTYRCQPSSSGNDYRLLQLEIPEGTESVDLTLVVQKPRSIDFMIRPELPQPGAR